MTGFGEIVLAVFVGQIVTDFAVSTYIAVRRRIARRKAMAAFEEAEARLAAAQRKFEERAAVKGAAS
jgi:hypothetical protein